jgi:hypothetical protein
VHGEVAVEADEEVLAAGVDAPHGAATEALRPAVQGVAALRRLDLDDRLADQRSTDPPRGPVDGIALGHPL